MSSALIKRDDANLTVIFAEEALQLKESALTSAALIGRVTNADENALAAGAQSQLADLRRAVEKSRVDAKAPILAYGKQIDTQAATFIAEILAEETRISKLAGDFHALEAAKARAAENLRRLEEQRIERERLEEMRRMAQEEADAKAVIKRQQDEAARLAREATNATQREEAERLRVETERQQKLAEAQSHERLDAINEEASNRQAAIQAAPAPVRAAGQTVKADIEITVTDLYALARAHPNCVTITPRLSEIKAVIAMGVKVAGVTFKEVYKSGTRSQKQPAAIEA